MPLLFRSRRSPGGTEASWADREDQFPAEMAEHCIPTGCCANASLKI